MLTPHEQELVRKAKREEREECAKMCDSMAYGAWLRPEEAGILRDIAAKIRARGDRW